MIGGVFVDKIGYGKLVVAAFALHVLSAFVTFGATAGMDNATAYQFLFWGMFAFGAANGTLEAVANPLVATVFPQARNHYLNILHASWPLGMVVGGVVGWVLGDTMNVGWKGQLACYLLPTIAYGVMFLGQKFPKSEASVKGLRMGEMFKDVGLLSGGVVCFMLYLFFKGTLTPLLDGDVKLATTLSAVISLGLLAWIGAITKFAIGHWLLFVLFIIHAMVGAVELGTDGWIQNITGAILTPDPRQDPLRLHLVDDVPVALLRPFHRDPSRTQADRPAVRLRGARLPRPESRQRRVHLRSGTWRAAGLCAWQDLLLAHHAGRHR